MTIHSGRLSALAWGLPLVGFPWGSPAAAAAASAFGPEVKVGEGKGGYVGALEIMPEHGKAGTPFTIKGEKLPPNQEFQLIWRTVNGRWKVTETEYKGREFVPADYLMAKVKSDAQGRFTASFTTPDDFGFEHDIVLQQATRLMTQVAYTVDMPVDLAPTSGPVATPIKFTFKCKVRRRLL